MIRDLTKSAMSLSWALSLLGMKQVFNVGREQQRGGDLFTPMTQVAVEQMDDSTRGIFRSGDSLQSRAVDMAFAWMNPVNWLNPNAWMRPFTNCGQQSAGQWNRGNQMGGLGDANGYGRSGYGSGSSYGSGFGCRSGSADNGFTQAAADTGQAFGRAAAGFTEAIGRTTAGMAQSVSGYVPFNRQTDPPVSNDSAATGWAGMRDDQL